MKENLDYLVTKLSGPERKAGGNALLETGATAGSKPGASDSVIPRPESKPLPLEEFLIYYQTLANFLKKLSGTIFSN